VSFAAGDTSKTITVNVSGDTVVESDEGFTVTLSGPTNGSVIGTASADGLIQNDDFAAIETAGATRLDRVANQFFLHDSGGNGPSLKFQGTAFTVGQFGAWTPIGAEKAGSGYQVVWKNGAADQYLVWSTDGSGNWLSQSATLSGASTALQVLEPGFNQDLNGVGGITARTVIESAGSTALAKIANTFVVSPTTSALGLQLMMSGAAVTVGQFGNWTPIGAEQAANGTYQVAWKNGAADQYLVWSTDGSGNWLSQTSVMSGSSSALKAYESTFKQDLNLNGMIDVVSSMISSNASTAQIASASSATVNVALFTSYMASAFATPGGESTGGPTVAETFHEQLLAKPAT
jgi:hypothetical protein